MILPLVVDYEAAAKAAISGLPPSDLKGLRVGLLPAGFVAALRHDIRAKLCRQANVSPDVDHVIVTMAHEERPMRRCSVTATVDHVVTCMLNEMLRQARRKA